MVAMYRSSQGHRKNYFVPENRESVLWKKRMFSAVSVLKLMVVLWESRVQQLCTCQLFIQNILDSASLFIVYAPEHGHLGFGMLTVETAVFGCICWFSSSRDIKGLSYLVEYCLESVEEYFEGNIHKRAPEPWNGNVHTVYFTNQARELVAQMFAYIWASCLEQYP